MSNSLKYAKRLQWKIRVGRWLPVWWYRRVVYQISGRDPWTLFGKNSDE